MRHNKSFIAFAKKRQAPALLGDKCGKRSGPGTRLLSYRLALNPEGAIAAHAGDRDCVDERSRSSGYIELINLWRGLISYILVANNPSSHRSIDFFPYPAGGEATKTITKDLSSQRPHGQPRAALARQVVCGPSEH
jgi:hypothetical protein